MSVAFINPKVHLCRFLYLCHDKYWYNLLIIDAPITANYFSCSPEKSYLSLIPSLAAGLPDGFQ